MKARKLWLPALVVAVCVGMVAVPATASAAGGTKAAAAKKKKASTARLKRSNEQLRKRLVRAERSLRQTGRGIDALVKAVKGNREGLAFLTGAAPQIVDALTQLRDGSLALKSGLLAAGTGLKQIKAVLENEVGPGLLALRSALENEVAPGMKALESGLTDLAGAVQGPGIAGQLGAAGTAAPGSSNSATPAELPTGTVYRQIVLLDPDGGGPTPAIPIGARTWIKMPDVSGLYSNSWACTSGDATQAAATAIGSAATVEAAAACPALT